ncbi:exonuclease domain-containing protein [Shouchella shacheensis]|uniref:exonuclease domain-containing protein n=1 Tax=Shouchella shacheensis TaxID=1649580 RepID=UPI00074012F6|nr:exonuclease domain-containing protein [Shouchella shacheensis]
MMNQMMHYMRQLSSRLHPSASASTPENAAQLARLRKYQKEAQADVLGVSFAKLPVVVFDFETSGFYPDQGDTILSIGAVKVTGSTVHREHFYQTIRSKKEPPPAILSLTGLTKEELDDSEPLEEVLLAFYDFIGSATLVAHHASHEKRFLRHATWQELGRTFTHRLVDTTFLTSITASNRKCQTLEEWCEAYNIPVTQRHHALADARMTAKLWATHVTKAEHGGYTCLHDIYKELALRR